MLLGYLDSEKNYWMMELCIIWLHFIKISLLGCSLFTGNIDQNGLCLHMVVKIRHQAFLADEKKSYSRTSIIRTRRDLSEKSV